ncbi:polymorphic toxin-type HINT domain-containing protein [Streptomyces niveus]|uniref:polymorphic toxin-type HINT domain-containing protein n=1 Tax=Streptomyces niveus TaxID=193462 RepID=UPI0036A7BD2B
MEADELTAGQWLQTSSGTWVQISAVTHRAESTTVYNLTVDDIHTYYVLAGAASFSSITAASGLGARRRVPPSGPTARGSPTSWGPSTSTTGAHVSGTPSTIPIR